MRRTLIKLITRHYLRAPDQEARVQFYFPDWGSLFKVGLNEAWYRLGGDRSGMVQNVAVELTNRCNLRCRICAHRGGLTRPAGTMAPATFDALLERNPGINILNFVGWGEQLLHPDCPEYLGRAARRGIFTALETNGTLLDDDRIGRLLDSGLRYLTVSMDGIDGVYESIRGFEYARFERNLLALLAARARRSSPLHIDINCVLTPEVEAQHDAIVGRWGDQVNSLRFSPYLEYNEPRDGGRVQPCRELWRGICLVLWDGRVTPCCMDFNGELIVGDIREATLAELFNGPRWRALRRTHRAGGFPDKCRHCYEQPSRYASNKF